ncbi:hypothetical protein H6F88_23135 [Oculatella sp. FACHB-28]|uniref:hypothetical protein n=1 Tax=Oculatella sp. FACHB-28 TaxID=2692845 RepID=UPI0016837BDE|nr:hypothetical protein [Oculatella sp. FACHB-28]MBD2058861.1 hypothetical protein [Oculatella sp. FACHB-28]
MAKLMMALKTGGSRNALISVSRPSDYVRDVFWEVFVTGAAQKFIWFPDFILFFPLRRSGNYWTEIYASDTLELQPETVRAIAVPFTIESEFERIIVSDRGYESPAVDNQGEGSYQLLFEARYLTVDEANRLNGFDWYTSEISKGSQMSAPELIRLTFIPTADLLEPQILRAEAGFNPPQTLSLNHSYQEPPRRTDIPFVLSAHITPETLEFIYIFEQTLQEFYQIERPHARICRGSAFGDPEDPIWAEVIDIPSVFPFAISIKRDETITLGLVAWGRFGQIHHVIWQLEHTSEEGFSWNTYNCGMIRCDAEDLQQLLLLLKEKAKIHFQPRS